MARRSSKSSGGEGCIAFVFLLGIIGLAIAAMATVVAAVIVIALVYGAVKLISKCVSNYRMKNQRSNYAGSIRQINDRDNSLPLSDTWDAGLGENVVNQPKLIPKRNEEAKRIAKRIDYKKTDKDKMVRYNSIVERKGALEKTIKDDELLLIKNRQEIEEKQRIIDGINSYDGKPIFMKKEIWLEKNLKTTVATTNQIERKKENEIEIQKRIVENKEQLQKIYFRIPQYSNELVEKIKFAIRNLKKVGHISGGIDLQNSSIDYETIQEDLKHFKHQAVPISLEIDSYRFYIFPSLIVVFSGANTLEGIFKPSAISISLDKSEVEKKRYYAFYEEKPQVYNDTKIISKEIPRYTWLHTCRDGSPDMRYKHNPRQTYYEKKEYYVF